LEPTAGEQHVYFGMERPAAEEWASDSDQANAEPIEKTKASADRIISWS
jgi:hypothetical protein